MYGKTGVLHHRYKGGMPKCLDCGKQIWWQSKRCKNCCAKGRLNPRYGKVSARLIGKDNPMYGRTGNKNPNWIDGRSFVPYPIGWTNTFKEQIRYRDNYRCQDCGIPEVESKRRLHVHHIDCDKNNLDVKNLVSLCCSCHSKRHNLLRKVLR